MLYIASNIHNDAYMTCYILVFPCVNLNKEVGTVASPSLYQNYVIYPSDILTLSLCICQCVYWPNKDNLYL